MEPQPEARNGSPASRVKLGTVDELKKAGWITGKVGSRPVCVFWDESKGCAYAVEDRCPHMGFPLHRGTVQSGLLTCHWHHARFDLTSGGTLDPFADDVKAYPVEIADGDVSVVVEARSDEIARLRRRLQEGLEQGITLVIAKAVIGLLNAGVDESEIVETGVEFGITYRGEGWGSGLTVLVAMSNILPYLDEGDRSLALVHGLAFLGNDTRGNAPRFPLEPLTSDPGSARLAEWYRRFIDTRSSDAAERTLATAVSSGHDPAEIATMMVAAVTDHVFIEEGHVLDFTNKAFESLAILGWEKALQILPTLVSQTAWARRHEEESEWRNPDDLARILAETTVTADLAARLQAAPPSSFSDTEVDALAWALLSESPEEVVGALDGALDSGATPEQMARAVVYAASLRIVRFHTQNDHGDWNSVHHAFTTANALHQATVRSPSPELVRGVYQCALRVFLDRFLNVPAARLPSVAAVESESEDSPMDALANCWDIEGKVDEAGSIVYGMLAGRTDPEEIRAVIAALAHQLLTEDSQFHWYQILEGSIRQFSAWPPGSEQGALIMAGAARFLAAHTPTRRELSHVVHIATRLRRGEPLYEDAADAIENAKAVEAVEA